MKKLYEFLINNRSTGVLYENDFVDLGLDVLWAKCNIGANKPEEIGLYYSWADVKGHRLSERHSFIDSNSKYRNPDGYNFSNPPYLKYFKGSKTTLDNSDDIASVKYGASCHLPSIKNAEDLINNCTFENCKTHFIFTSKINDNSIVFPNSQLIRSNELSKHSNTYLWLNTIAPVHYNVSAKVLDFNSIGKPHINGVTRSFGLNARAVKDK